VEHSTPKKLKLAFPPINERQSHPRSVKLSEKWHTGISNLCPDLITYYAFDKTLNTTQIQIKGHPKNNEQEDFFIFNVFLSVGWTLPPPD
jgi:hypothetical protein